MNIILLEKVHGLGGLGDQVSVKSGFGRNYLIPTGKAVSASAANIEKFEARRAELQKAAAELLQAAQARASQLENITITISAKAGEEGKLFGSLGTADLAKAITDKGVNVIKSEVLLPNGALRTLGEHHVALQLHADIAVTVKIDVIAEA